MTTALKIMPRKPPAKRLFSGMVGMPPEEVTTSVPVTSAVAQVQQTVDRVIAAAGKVKQEYAPERDEQVRQAMSSALSPAEAAPAKRRRGRPRKYDGETVQERERNRKRDKRDKAKCELANLLRYFELSLESEIPPGLKTKYGIDINTYRELLGSDRVLTKVYKEIIRELKIIGVIKTPASTKQSAGKYMAEAPHAKGLLVLSGKPEKIHGLRQSREHGLSKPDDRADDNFVPPESLLSDAVELPAGDRRRAAPTGHGPDDL